MLDSIKLYEAIQDTENNKIYKSKYNSLEKPDYFNIKKTINL